MTGTLLTALAAALICALLYLLLCRLVLTPVRPGKNTRQQVLLEVSGPEPALEQNAAGLLWLNDNGILRCRIVIRGSGLDEETRLTALALERDHSCITFIDMGDKA